MSEPNRPIRVRQRRGVSLPDGTRSCARPHRFGNPFKVGGRDGALARVPATDLVTPWEYEGRLSADGVRHDCHWPGGDVTVHHVRYMTVREVIATHRRALLAPTPGLRLFHPRSRTYVTVDLVRRELAGWNLACYCQPGDPCHVDTLLWVANADEAEVKEAVEAEYEIVRAMAERVAALHPEILVSRPAA